MATICAGRCFLSHIDSNPSELYTFGSPRVGDKRYVNFIALQHYRFVNNNDIVTRVPPAWMGYRHTGDEVYIDHRGQIREIGRLARRRDRLRGFLKSLRRWKIDHFSDHSIHGYIQAIAGVVAGESNGDQHSDTLEPDEGGGMAARVDSAAPAPGKSSSGNSTSESEAPAPNTQTPHRLG